MSFTTRTTSVYGTDMFMFPLINHLSKNNKIHFYGHRVLGYRKNIFCNLLNLEPYILDVTFDLETSNNMDRFNNLDCLLMYNRPKEAEDEYQLQNFLIEKAVKKNIPVLFWLGDLWLPPENLSKDITLLRPFSSKVFDSNFKNAFEFNYFTHPCTLPVKEKVIDYLYVGNQYNRWEEFKAIFEKLDGNVVVAGNWLKNKNKWDNSLQLKNVLYIGEIPHSMALPLYNISKQTFYIIPPQYQQVGMLTSRLYEAQMGNCKVLNTSFKNLNTLDNAVQKLEEILNV